MGKKPTIEELFDKRMEEVRARLRPKPVTTIEKLQQAASRLKTRRPQQ